MSAIEAARTLGVPFATLVLMWIDHRSERKERRKDRRTERKQLTKAIKEQTDAFRSLRTEVRVLTDGGREEKDE